MNNAVDCDGHQSVLPSESSLACLTVSPASSNVSHRILRQLGFTVSLAQRVAAFCDHICHVFIVGSGEQMREFHARAHVALMQNQVSVRQHSAAQDEGDARRAKLTFIPVTDDAVAVTILSAGPKQTPALGSFAQLFSETNLKWYLSTSHGVNLSRLGCVLARVVRMLIAPLRLDLFYHSLNPEKMRELIV